MKVASVVVLAFVGVAAVLVLRGTRPSVRVSDDRRRVLYYRDPMHPSYTSNVPGKAPDCGMPLEPVYGEPGQQAPPAGRESQPHTVSATETQQRIVGVERLQVRRDRTRSVLHTVGRVVVDDTRVYPLAAGGDGWVLQRFPGTARGNRVRQGQPLVKVYGRDFATVQRAYLYALRALENPPSGTPSDPQNSSKTAVEEARLVLVNMGISDSEIEALARSRQITLETTIVAPHAGVIVSENAFPRMGFARGMELFRIADLTHVWVVADLFTEQSALVHPGDSAEVVIPNAGGSPVRATISDALMTNDGDSRTLKLRLLAENRSLTLVPGMTVDVAIAVQLPDAIAVPASALIESGTRTTVVVDKGGGLFEERRVVVGWRLGNDVQIVSGLNPGDVVITSGTFLLDAQMRIQDHGPSR